MTEQLVRALLERFAGLQREEVPEDEFRDGTPVLVVAPEQIIPVGRFLRDQAGYGFDLLKSVTAVDYEDRMTVVYHLYSVTNKQRLTLKVVLGREDPAVDSVAGVWSTAGWQEREVFDLMGIRFDGHEDLRRIMLPEEWSGHPLRKDYVHEPDPYD